MRNFLKRLLRIFYGSLSLPELLFNEIKYRFREDNIRIGFANDYFEGNLYEIFLSLKDRTSCFWVTTEKKTLRNLKNKGIEAYYYWNPGTKIIRPKAWIVSNNDRIPVKRKNTLWVNTHHDIAFKGLRKELLLKDRIQFLKSPHPSQFNAYDIHFLSSRIIFDYYKNHFGLDKKTLKIVGEPRTDPLIKGNFDREKIIHGLKLDSEKKTILYAPTWSHDFDDLNKKGLFPDWDQDQEKLLEEVCHFIEEWHLNLIIRLHKYAERGWMERFDDLINKFKNIIKMSMLSHPDSMPYLFISDILITDYSSIANDYILLNRPIIYLKTDYDLFDGEYALSPSYMAGHIVKSKREFFKALIDSLENPKKFSQKRKEIAKKLHVKLDGRASERAAQIILNEVKK